MVGQPARWILVGLLALTTVTPSSAWAQAPANDLAEVEQMAYALFQFSRISSMQDRRVQHELALEPAQVVAVTQLAQVAEQLQRGVQRLQPNERRQRMQTEYLPAARRLDIEIRRVLRAEQLTRLDQIVYQHQIGAIVLLMPGVPEFLQMSDAQRLAIRGIVDENLRSINWDRFDTLIEKARVARLAKAGRERAFNTLNAAQQQRWAAFSASR
jgi:hypothetical protein